MTRSRQRRPWSGIRGPTVLYSTVGLIGLTTAQLSYAGNLDRCDLARVAARNTVMDAYSHVFSQLESMTSKAAADDADKARVAYTDKDGIQRFVDMTGLTAVLKAREAADLGHADKAVAGECGGDADAEEHAVKVAGSLAKRDISTVLSQHLTNVDLSRLLPRS